MEEKEIADIKAKTLDLCVKCNKELKVHASGGGMFDFTSTSKGAFYCQNKECDFYGVLTLAHIPKTEKLEDNQK